MTAGAGSPARPGVDRVRCHTLVREQRLDSPPREAFAFFSDAHNLEAITPPWLGFEVLTPRPIDMRGGTWIKYRLVLHRVPLRWLTRIEVWEPGRRFVDVQVRGPYRLWRHTHEFYPAPGGGTRMSDVVRYALPFGVLGAAAHVAFVRRDLARIFDFRQAETARRLARS